MGNFLLYWKNEGSDKRGPDNRGSTVYVSVHSAKYPREQLKFKCELKSYYEI